MKFQFTKHAYQTDAVESVVKIFNTQPPYKKDKTAYRIDVAAGQFRDINIGYGNAPVEISPEQLLKNLQAVQQGNNIPQSAQLAETHGLGICCLDIEMETGTGKTYVYIKTMFELNKHYGWSKFIVVVPSIAIREGVNKSFAMLEDHFMDQYGKKIRYFVYDSGNLNRLDDFSRDASIQAMIINSQAFASSLKENGRAKESRIIYSRRDSFGSRRPIDVIAANNPIVIIDEPQKLEGEATLTGLKKFNPLFTLNYSATHKTKHDTIYALDALDAYNNKLVKQIEVKGFELHNLRGTSGYLYLDSIILSKNNPPQAKIEFEKKISSGDIRRTICIFAVGDDLFSESR